MGGDDRALSARYGRAERPIRRRAGPAARLRAIPAEETEIDLNAFVAGAIGPIVVALALLLFVALAAVLLLLRRTSRLEGRLAGLTRGEDGESLETVLARHLEHVVRLGGEVRELSGRTSRIEADARHAVTRVGLVRFNPFEDTGGDQSFALALLDADHDGIVVSSLHARGLTRIYAKSISGGRPEATLSEEEAEAVAMARSDSLGRAGLGTRVDAGGRAGRDRAVERAGT